MITETAALLQEINKLKKEIKWLWFNHFATYSSMVWVAYKLGFFSL